MKDKVNIKADPLFYENVGVHIEKWLRQNAAARQQPKNGRELIQILKRKFGYELSPSQLSRYINGVNIFPAELQSLLVDQLGFKYQVFADYIINKRDGLKLKQLTIDDLHKFIYEQGELLNSFKEGYYKFSAGYYTLANEMSTLAKDVMKYVEKNEALRKELRELKQQIRNSATS